MLESGLAQTLAKRIMKSFGYNINIMNEKGIIIASGSPKRIGDFHEAAYEVITQELEHRLVKPGEDNCIGVKPGVTVPIMNEGEIIGAVSISGNPEEVFRYADLVRMSVEAMIENAYYKEQVRQKQNKKNVFCNALLFEEPFNINRVENLAKHFQYDITIPRVPIKIALFSFKDNESILEKIKCASLHTKQDMAMTLGDNSIAIFKTISGNEINRYRENILSYIDSIKAVLPEPEKYSFGVSTIQRRIEDYRMAFGFLTWLEHNIKPERGKVYFFVHYSDEYFHDLVPFEVCDSVFSAFLDSVDKYGREIFVETALALYDCSMNVNEAAQALFVHRNTILLRIKKMKELIGIDPMHNIKDRHIMFHLADYVSEIDRMR